VYIYYILCVHCTFEQFGHPCALACLIGARQRMGAVENEKDVSSPGTVLCVVVCVCHHLQSCSVKFGILTQMYCCLATASRGVYCRRRFGGC